MLHVQLSEHLPSVVLTLWMDLSLLSGLALSKPHSEPHSASSRSQTCHQLTSSWGVTSWPFCTWGFLHCKSKFARVLSCCWICLLFPLLAWISPVSFLLFMPILCRLIRSYPWFQNIPLPFFPLISSPPSRRHHRSFRLQSWRWDADL